MSNSSTVTQVRTELKAPSMWKVVLHNDDFTPIDFVVALLCEVFHKSADDAIRLAQHVHTNGRAHVALYTKEIAVEKVRLCDTISKEHGHPLKTTAEQA